MNRTFKKALSAVLTIIMLLSVCAVGFSSSATEFVGYTAISTKEDLYNIRNNTSGNYYLINDIVFTEEDTLWTPIETFSGILDGNGFSIKGLKINSKAFADELSVGMINKLYGKICNLTMEGGETRYYTDRYSYTAEKAYLYVGTFAGTNYGEIENCHNSNIVNSTSEYVSAEVYVGGIAGRVYEGSIKNCTNSSVLFSTHFAGGITGYSHMSDISGCSNSGRINSDYEYACAAGIACWVESSAITDCFNTGEIYAYYPVVSGNPFDADAYDFTNTAGGIAAQVKNSNKYNKDSIVSNCYNTGKVIGTCYVGGLIGLISYGYIEKCYNSGMVLSDHLAGGISGYTYGTSVSDCFNVAFVTTYTDYASFAKAGGICGIADYGEISNCYNVGPVTASTASTSKSDVGGVVGILSAHTLENCYYYSMFNEKGVGNKSNKVTQINNMIELSQEKTYKGFDFNNVWEIDYSTGYSFPILRGMDSNNIGLDWQLAMTDKKSVGLSVKHTGTCGDNLTWTIYSSNVLYITGTGDMYDYSISNPAPWSKYPFEKVAAITNGVTSVGDYAFYNCDKLATVFLGYDVERIGKSAFENCDKLVTTIVNEKVNYIGGRAFADCPNYVGTEYIGHIVQFFTILIENENHCFFMTKSAKTDSESTVDLINDVPKTTLNYGDVLWVTVDESKLPEGCHVEWDVANLSLSRFDDDGNNIAIQSLNKGGKDTLFAVVVDENYVAVRDENGDIMFDCIEINSKYNIFMHIIYFFRSFFRAYKIYK